jgi:uncharacterized ferritin-like protein (DUF455 family)
VSDETLFGEAPARDARFDVKERWSELCNIDPADPKHQTEFLHRQMNEEINSIEISARNLTDFPDAPWELRLAIARQCWDEARHCLAFQRLFEARGGAVGEFPVINFQYRIITRIDSLAGRLAVQNRSFEAAGIDAIDLSLRTYDAERDPEFVALFEMQLADEMQHVRFGNEWVKRLVETGGPRTTFEVARACAQATQAFAGVADGGSAMFYPISTDARREAGFSDDEIDGARRISRHNK